MHDLGIEIQPDAGDPMYRQIFDQIAGRIRSGAFPEGFRLPPTRSLAGSLGTHRNTVVRAYAELEAAGFLSSTVGRGTFVRAVGQPTEPPDEATAHRMPFDAMLSRSARAEPMRRFLRARRASVPRDTIDLTRMMPPVELLPIELFRRCVDHVLKTSGPKALWYAPKEGVRPLREQIVADLARRGVPSSAHDMLVTTGSQQALDLIARALLEPGDVVLTHASTYAGALQVFAATGAHVVGVPNDAEGPDLEALGRLGARRPKLLYLMPNHANPTGACISSARRAAILTWARDAQVAVIEDDYAVDLELEGAGLPTAMRALDADVIHVGSFSKRLIPSLRVGYVVTPPTLYPHLLALKHATDLGGSALNQLALAEFLDRGYMAGHLNKIQPAYRARRDALLDELRKHLPPEVRYQRPSRGVSVWLELPAGYDLEAIFEESLSRRVLVSPGYYFAVDDGAQAGLRLNFGWEPEARLREGARRLGESLSAIRARDPSGPAVELV